MSGRVEGEFDIELLGDAALLLRFGDRIDAELNARVHAFARALRAASLTGVHEIVPAYASIAVHYDPATWFDASSAMAPHARVAAHLLQALSSGSAGGEGWVRGADDLDSSIRDQSQEPPSPQPSPPEERAIIEIPVCYGDEFGPDLAEVAEHAKLSVAEVISLHGAAEYRVAMLGFAPGFPYLLGLDTRLVTPRRASPRTRVPVGSVAIGGAQTGIYPRELPGGWRLIGRTPLTLFDAQRDPPALLWPGQRVRFKSIENASAFAPERENPKTTIPDHASHKGSVQVLSPGLLTTVQDGGRVGHAAIGVGAAGAMDPVALRLANLLVGNTQNAAALEITLRGPRLRFELDALIALAGAEIDARCDDIAVPTWRPVLLRAGSELVLGGMRSGARAYLAISGGFDLPPALGSRSTDLNAGIGPIARALAAGDVLPCSPASRALCHELWAALDGPRNEPEQRHFAAAKYSLDPAPWFETRAESSLPLHLIPGSHFDLLDADSQRALFEHEFRIGVDSNRVGLRLEGAPLQLARPHELISEGAAPGTLQLPPAGAPIVLAAEAPTTGGYPRIGHIASIDQPRLAQRRPGDTLRFVRCEMTEAQMRYLERERALSRLACTIAERLQR